MALRNQIILFITLFVFISLVTSSPASLRKREINKNANKSVRYCQPQTPCAWMIYSYIERPEIYFTNDYCKCRTEQTCAVHENVIGEGYLEYRCK